MDPSFQLNVPKIETPHDFDWLNEDPFENLLDLPPLESLLEFNDSNPTPLTFQSKTLEYMELEDFWKDSNINGSSSLYGNMATNLNLVKIHIPSKATEAEEDCSSLMVLSESMSSNEPGEESSVMSKRKKKSEVLELEEIKKYFDRPITRAAREMNVGLTVLKKRCRELNIMRWPHRKIKSLRALINNVKELGLSEEIGMLEEHKRLIENLPDLELTERTKKLRQACFKANYKKRRSLAFGTFHG